VSEFNFAQQYTPSGVALYGSAIAASAPEPVEPERWTDITVTASQ